MTDDRIDHYGGTDDTGEMVKATYVCVECSSRIELTDYQHRTRVGFGTPTIWCDSCNNPLERIE